jgi:hypothetical protein
MLKCNEISFFKVASLQYVAMGESLYRKLVPNNSNQRFQKLNYKLKAIKVLGQEPEKYEAKPNYVF